MPSGGAVQNLYETVFTSMHSNKLKYLKSIIISFFAKHIDFGKWFLLYLCRTTSRQIIQTHSDLKYSPLPWQRIELGTYSSLSKCADHFTTERIKVKQFSYSQLKWSNACHTPYMARKQTPRIPPKFKRNVIFSFRRSQTMPLERSPSAAKV